MYLYFRIKQCFGQKIDYDTEKLESEQEGVYTDAGLAPRILDSFKSCGHEIIRLFMPDFLSQNGEGPAHCAEFVGGCEVDDGDWWIDSKNNNEEQGQNAPYDVEFTGEPKFLCHVKDLKSALTPEALASIGLMKCSSDESWLVRCEPSSSLGDPWDAVVRNMIIGKQVCVLLRALTRDATHLNEKHREQMGDQDALLDLQILTLDDTTLVTGFADFLRQNFLSMIPDVSDIRSAEELRSRFEDVRHCEDLDDDALDELENDMEDAEACANYKLGEECGSHFTDKRISTEAEIKSAKEAEKLRLQKEAEKERLWQAGEEKRKNERRKERQLDRAVRSSSRRR